MFVFVLCHYREHDLISFSLHNSLCGSLRGADELMGNHEWTRAYDVPDNALSWTHEKQRIVIERKKVHP